MSNNKRETNRTIALETVLEILARTDFAKRIADVERSYEPQAVQSGSDIDLMNDYCYRPFDEEDKLFS